MILEAVPTFHHQRPMWKLGLAYFVLSEDVTSYGKERFDIHKVSQQVIHLVMTQTMSWLDVKCESATVVGGWEGFDFGAPKSLST
jgi:hypothetical protein